MKKKPIIIVVHLGVVISVRDMPKDCDYEIIDFDILDDHSCDSFGFPKRECSECRRIASLKKKYL